MILTKVGIKLNNKPNKMITFRLISGFLAGLAIIGISVYQMIDKYNTGLEAQVWQDFALIAVAIFLMVVMVLNLKKQKKS